MSSRWTKWTPLFNPEKVLSPPQKARLQGKIDYLEGKDSDPMRHYYKEGGADEFHYLNGYDKEFHDCVDAVMSINGQRPPSCR